MITATEYFNERWETITSKLEDLQKSHKSIERNLKSPFLNLDWSDATDDYRQIEVLLTEAATMLHVMSQALNNKVVRAKNQIDK